MSTPNLKQTAQSTLSSEASAKEVLDGSGFDELRAAILQDLATSRPSATGEQANAYGKFPFHLMQHPYRPGLSVDLNEEFNRVDWASRSHENLAKLAE